MRAFYVTWIKQGNLVKDLPSWKDTKKPIIWVRSWMAVLFVVIVGGYIGGYAISLYVIGALAGDAPNAPIIPITAGVISLMVAALMFAVPNVIIFRIIKNKQIER